MANSATIEMFRFDPSTDAEPAFKTYEFPIADENQVWSVLKALHYINRRIEPISYEYNCRYGACGMCGVFVDGMPRLACWSRVDTGKTYRVEPLPGFPVIKDLVIDRKRTYERFVGTDASIKTYEPIINPKALDGDLWWGPIKNLNRCRECMSCYAVCPVLQEQNKWEEFIGPGAMMQVYLRYIDTEDQAARLQQATFSGLFACDLCGKCGTVCPAHIDIPGHLKAMQADAEAQGMKLEGDASAPSWPLA
ncbi:MAG: 4Fe-4S dicluster domain-containing protein [Coriobacteriales bacterium]|jgi:succinate dehydrogenase/fumarate reductase iron-sulfur protein|nr:4Fe-4S dicluster domain-containing protein [Coriobacteriales bacterium]